MATVEQIDRDIAVIEEAVNAIATELEGTYISYLTALGQAVGKQLMLATYHLCTQGYPQQFVSLSLNERQQLQQKIRKLGQEAAERLREHTEADDSLEFSFLQEKADLETVNKERFANPIELVKWQHRVERAIASTLKMLSSKSNNVLQQAGILPNKLPLSPLLEAATSSLEATPEAINGPPNLLNLLVETDSERESQESSVTQITAIHLRLVEIEFADATVRAGRNQIRNLLGKVSKIERDYQKKQRERDVAEAEAAWRSSWFES